MINKVQLSKDHINYIYSYDNGYVATLLVMKNEVHLQIDYRQLVIEGNFTTFQDSWVEFAQNEVALTKWKFLVGSQLDKEESIEAARAALSKQLL